MHRLADVALRHAAVLLQQRQDLAIESVELHRPPRMSCGVQEWRSAPQQRNSVANCPGNGHRVARQSGIVFATEIEAAAEHVPCRDHQRRRTATASDGAHWARRAGRRSAPGCATLEDYRPTPLVALPALAAASGVESIHIKDEGQRLGLKSFKALGGAYAVASLVLAEAGKQAWPQH